MNSVADALHKLACLCFWIAATFTFADDLVSDVPFVSGFDRFGRHADIDQVTAGRLLITELSCTACHAAEDALLLPKRGPVLDWPDARAGKWANWVCGENGNLLRSPVSNPLVFTQGEGAQQGAREASLLGIRLGSMLRTSPMATFTHIPLTLGHCVLSIPKDRSN